MIPQEALTQAARWYLQLDGFEVEQVLEKRLASALEESNISAERSTFLDTLADATPTPGGGSASAYSAASGAALVEMVARLTIGRKKYAPVKDAMQACLEGAGGLRSGLTKDIERDAAAFNAVMKALRLPQDTPEQQLIRQQTLDQATLEAARVPLEVAGKSVEVLDLALQVVSHGNLNAISDGATGGALARAGLTGAGYNVRINLASLSDAAPGAVLLNRLQELEARADVLENELQTVLQARGGFSF